MTSSSGADHAAEEARVEDIQARLAELRAQTLVLTTRVGQATAQAAEIRTTPRPICNHAEQAEEMAAAIGQLEHELDGLRVAMATRGVIEQAKGMLMLQRHCDADAAFALLVDLSQTSHRKLVEVARTLVESWTAEDHVRT